MHVRPLEVFLLVLSIKMGASDVKWLDMCLSLGNCKNALASPVTSQGEHISWTPLVGPKVMKSTMAKLIQVCLVSGLKVVAFGPSILHTVNSEKQHLPTKKSRAAFCFPEKERGNSVNYAKNCSLNCWSFVLLKYSKWYRKNTKFWQFLANLKS